MNKSKFQPVLEFYYLNPTYILLFSIFINDIIILQNKKQRSIYYV